MDVQLKHVPLRGGQEIRGAYAIFKNVMAPKMRPIARVEAVIDWLTHRSSADEYELLLSFVNHWSWNYDGPGKVV